MAKLYYDKKSPDHARALANCIWLNTKHNNLQQTDITTTQFNYREIVVYTFHPIIAGTLDSIWQFSFSTPALCCLPLSPT